MRYLKSHLRRNKSFNSVDLNFSLCELHEISKKIHRYLVDNAIVSYIHSFILPYVYVVTSRFFSLFISSNLSIKKHWIESVSCLPLSLSFFVIGRYLNDIFPFALLENSKDKGILVGQI